MNAWEKRKYGDITKSFQYGLNAPAKKFDGINKYLRITDIDDHTRLFKQESLTSPDTNLSNASTYLLKQGDVLFARTGASTGKTYKYRKRDGKVYFAGFLIRAELKPKFDSEFFYQTTLTDSFLDFVKVTSQRSGQPGINSKEYANKAIQVPELSEQQRIGSVLAIYDNLIAATQHKIDALEQAKKALLQRLFDQSWRFKGYSDPWEKRKLSDYAVYRRGSFPQPYGNKEWYNGSLSMPFVQVVDVSSNLRLNESTKQRISQQAQPMSVFVPAHSIVVTLQGSIGRVAITQYDAYVDRTLLIFERFLHPTDKVFFAYVLQKKFSEEKDKAPGGTIKTITKEALSSFEVLTPIISEQHEIGSLLKNLDNLIAATQSRLFSLELLKKSLLQDLFI